MNKNLKYRVCLLIPLALIIIFMVSLFAFIWFILYSTNEEKEKLFLLLLIMLALLPFGLVIWSVITMLPIVRIDEEGIERSLFRGFLKRKITWEELYEVRIVKTNGSYTPWLFFSTKDLKGKGVTGCRLSRNTVFIMVMTKKMLDSIREFLKEKNIIIKE